MSEEKTDYKQEGQHMLLHNRLYNKFYTFLKYSDITSPVRNSSYPVKTIIENPVLAWFNLLGKISLAFYLIFVFFHESLYYKLFVPKVHVDYWADKSDLTSIDENDYVYCNNNTYDYVYSANWLYTNNKCTWVEYSETYKKGDLDFFFFATYFQETSRARRVNCTPDDDIFDDLGLSYESCMMTSSGSDTVCDCTDSENYFILGAEESVFAFSLAYYVSEINVDGITSDSDVKVVLLGPEGNQYKKISNSDRYITYTIQEYLSAAGIHLDNLNTHAPGANGTMPHYRISGVTLILDVEFYNMPIYHNMDEWSSKTVGVIKVRPEKGWSSMGSRVTYHEYPNLKGKTQTFYYTDRYRYGVKLIFQQGGYIGHMDRATIQSYFITSIVLFAVIPAVVARLGILLFGFNSRIYQEQLKRHPDGIIRDMQHYQDTFNFLFNDYDAYIESRIGGETLDWCCCRLVYKFYNQKKDTVSKKEWEKFCETRKFTKEQEVQMWYEINNNPYLATKTSFNSTTMWEAVRKNYDKISGRQKNELKTLIRAKWKLWDEECHEENFKRHMQVQLTSSFRPDGLSTSLILGGDQASRLIYQNGVASEGIPTSKEPKYSGGLIHRSEDKM